MQCYTPNPATDPLGPGNPALEECRTDPPGAFALALKIHILRYSGGTGGLNDDQIPLIMKRLEEAFSPFDIYFLLKCVNEISDTYYYENPEGLLTSLHADPEALNLFVLPGSNFSQAAGIVSNKAYLYFDNEDNYKILAHETGHALGLFHTFKGNPYGNEAGTQEYADQENHPNCCTAGDFVCDTPSDPNIRYNQPQYGNTGAQPDCSWETPTVTDAFGDLYTGVLVDNIMSYYPDSYCEKVSFTPGQGIRMRYILANTMNSGLPLQPARRDEALISQNTTWNSPKEFDTDVLVLSGKTLTIQNTTVKMARGRRITVQKGGRLNVLNSTVTLDPTLNDCPYESFWKGIEAKGGDTENEFPSYVYVSGSTIELAEAGIFYPRQEKKTSYGLIRCFNSQFLNNKSALEMVASNDQTSWYSNFYVHYILNCQFVLDSGFPVNEISDHQVNLGKVSKSIFGGCTFQQLYASQFTTATRAFDSNIRVITYGAAQTPSSFSGFGRGVVLLHAHGSEVNGAHFEGGLYGIYADGANGISLRNCDIEIGTIADVQRTGIRLLNSTGYSVFDNTIYTDPNSTLLTSSQGIWVENSGTFTNLIARNTLNRVRYGFRVNRVNADPLNQFTGLNLLCNTHNNPGSVSIPNGPYDFYVPIDGTLALNQGSTEKSAGNVFTGNTTPAGADYNNSGNVITYFYYQNDQAQNPDNNIGLEPIGVLEQPDCSSLGVFDPQTPNQVTGLLAQYLTLKDEYDDLLDDGDTGGLQQAVTNANSTTGKTLKPQLLSISPYLSAAVLAAVHENATAFTQTDRYNILSANPDALKDGDLRNLIETSPVKLSQTYRQNLLALNKPLTDRSYREMQLNDLSQEMETGLSGFTRLAYQDTTTTDLSDARYWLGQLPGFQRDLQQAESWLREGDLTNYAVAAQEMVNKYGSDPEKGMDAYSAYTDAMLYALTTDQGFFGLDSTTVADLEEEALNTPSDLIRSMIGNFLLVYYDVDISGQQGQKNAGGVNTTVGRVKPEVADQSGKGWQIHPNPAGDQVFISGKMTGAAGELTIFDALGRRVLSENPVLTGNNIAVDLSGLKSGLYFLQLSASGRTLFRTRLVINR